MTWWQYFLGKKKPPMDEEAYWERYQTCFSTAARLSELIPCVRFVVLDIESSGLHPLEDRILSFSAISVEDGRIGVSDLLECYIYQPEKWAVQQVEIHGIMPGSSRERLTERELAEKLLDFIGAAVLVGHHSDFDRAILNAMFRRLGHSGLRNQWLDTAQLALRVGDIPEGKYPDLDSLCTLYGIIPYDRHTATGDAYLTARLFLKLCARLEKRGVRNLKALLNTPGLL